MTKRAPPRPPHHALISDYGKRCAAFRNEDRGRHRCFAQELPQCPDFPKCTCIPALGTSDMHTPVPTVRSTSC